MATRMIATATMKAAHDPQSHRLDAHRVARLYGLTPTALARVIGAKPDTVRKRADAPILQNGLGKLVVAWDNLRGVFPDDNTIRTWLRHPIASLRGDSPLWLLETHGADSFSSLTEELLHGTYD